MELSRRSFVGTAAATAATAGLAMGTTAHASEDQAWDESFDVVVLGAGCAVVAALTAAKNGLSTLMVEKSDIIGGTSAVSGGGFWLPGNRLEVEEGLETDAEAGIQYGIECAKRWGGTYSEDVIRSYVKHGLEMWDMLENDLGYQFTIDPHATADYFNIDGQIGRGRAAGFLKGQSNANLTMDFWNRMCGEAQEFGCDVRTGCPALSLVRDETGVTGVVIDDNGVQKRVQAKKGVIIGTGGIDHNEIMCKAFLRMPVYHSTAAVGNTGDGHRMGMAVGANLVNMHSVWGTAMVLTDEEYEIYTCDWGSCRGKPGSIIVNKYGDRFCDESSAYPIIGRSFEPWDTGKDEYRNIPAFMLFDDGYAQRYAFPGCSAVGELPDAIVTADTIEALAERMGIDPAGLAKTIERFNAFAEAGYDEDWLRGESVYDVSRVSGDAGREDIANPCLAPLVAGPFYALKVFPGCIGTAGGLEIDGDARVLTPEGEAIPGLYAIGNASGSIFGGAYPGPGGTVGPGVIMGYAAAMHIAANR